MPPWKTVGANKGAAGSSATDAKKGAAQRFHGQQRAVMQKCPIFRAVLTPELDAVHNRVRCHLNVEVDGVRYDLVRSHVDEEALAAAARRAPPHGARLGLDDLRLYPERDLVHLVRLRRALHLLEVRPDAGELHVPHVREAVYQEMVPDAVDANELRPPAADDEGAVRREVHRLEVPVGRLRGAE